MRAQSPDALEHAWHIASLRTSSYLNLTLGEYEISISERKLLLRKQINFFSVVKCISKGNTAGMNAEPVPSPSDPFKINRSMESKS